MNNQTKQAMIELLTDELGRHRHVDDTIPGIYDVKYDKQGATLLKCAVNFVLGKHYRASEYDFENPSAFFDWLSQGRLAIISTCLVDQRELFELSNDMVERARQLMIHVNESQVPSSVRTTF